MPKKVLPLKKKCFHLSSAYLITFRLCYFQWINDKLHVQWQSGYLFIHFFYKKSGYTDMIILERASNFTDPSHTLLTLQDWGLCAPEYITTFMHVGTPRSEKIGSQEMDSCIKWDSFCSFCKLIFFCLLLVTCILLLHMSLRCCKEQWFYFKE